MNKETDNISNVGTLALLTQETASPSNAPGKQKFASNKKSEKLVTSSERGLKKGYSRHTYVLEKSMIEQIKNASTYFSMSESTFLQTILKRALETVVNDHGKKCLKPTNRIL